MQGTQPIALTLLGVETARAFVPEPSEAQLLWIGSLGLALLAARRRAIAPSV